MKCEQKNTGYCSLCPVIDCDMRRKETIVKKGCCDGNCNKCDRAIRHDNWLTSPIFEGLVENGICNIYHVQNHHHIEFYKRIGEVNVNSNIEKLIIKIEACHNCKYNNICRAISKGIEVDFSDKFDIAWNFGNQSILKAIPVEKAHAFLICETIQSEIKEIFTAHINECKESF